MSIWSRIFGTKETDEADVSAGSSDMPVSRDPSKYAFVDVEVARNNKVYDVGALRYDRAEYHEPNMNGLLDFFKPVDFIAGHNIVHHDAKYVFGNHPHRWALVDTLYMSPLLFPERPYHRLLKDDKLLVDQANNPLNDCEKARDLLWDEVNQWNVLPVERRMIFTSLLKGKREFDGFLQMMKAESNPLELENLIRTEFDGKICRHAYVTSLIKEYPVELAYALALIDTTDYRSITPGWVLANYPAVEHVVRLLRHTRCADGCPYCDSYLNIHTNLEKFFGYKQFRTFEGENLQEKAAQAAVDSKSLLAIFPTGGGKSLTFQLPALMEGQTVHGLTVVISPLQSLMKDQVDNLANRGITDAVTINGLLDPISRALSIERVTKGDASLLYISPEMLRSKTIERILTKRHVVRFVIDEAHCFSAWGQDFRVDYLYIGKFIRKYQERKRLKRPIPVSCFTATAKQKVIQDICDYFKQTLNLDLELFASSASRSNLRYSVIHSDTDADKYQKLRSLIAEYGCPTIVYVSRTRRTKDLAAKLTRDGFKALPFNGQMEADEKVRNQEAFMTDQVRIIVATSAFGMGVDKPDVGLVIHYDISESLENYVQEAGRAGRDPQLDARCYVLYSDGDLDKHFILLNQTKLSISEIQQVWRAIKGMTKRRERVECSALEIARFAGWDDSVTDVETRVRTALSALEQSGYIVRGNNVPHVYATGITVKNMDEARRRITDSDLFSKEDIEKAVRIMSSLISQKYVARAQEEEAESRVDYLADILGLTKKEVVSAVERMRLEGILADSYDISAYLHDVATSSRRPMQLLEQFARLEQFILHSIPDGSLHISYKQLNENAIESSITTSKEKDIRTLLYFLTIKGYVRKKEEQSQNLIIRRQLDIDTTMRRLEKRLYICRFAIEWLYRLSVELEEKKQEKEEVKTDHAVQFSVVELLKRIKAEEQSLFADTDSLQIEDVEEALLYLSKIGALKLEGGFMVLYNAMDIRRVKDSKYQYKIDDYRMLNEFYRLKIQQVHIVGEYANLMVKNYDAALQYVQDYFQMDYKKFISKYFKGERAAEIERNVSPERYDQLFGQLSERQMEIISDKASRCIVVAAGPGSGKTRVLVHKLASLLSLEDVKHEQLLMLTFSRAAATEFKQRLIDLIGNAAHFVEIKTFHSYCFDLLGRIGNLEEADDVVAKAAEMISAGEVEPSRIGKTVLVVDEAQDMSEAEYQLVKALMANNEEMRVIAVGDDDQNIFEFRGSDSGFLKKLIHENRSRFVEMTENYRSSRHVVKFANAFVDYIRHRMKKTPIVSMSEDEGFVGVTFHHSRQMYLPLVEELLRNKGRGTTCVLTQTNEEAHITAALLRKHGINSKLIQSIDGFKFYNLQEVRFFLKHISKHVSTTQISDEVWQEAKSETYRKYEGSSCLAYVRRCVELFENTNQKKYLTDFKEYLFESSVEDFCDFSGADVVVSTIHKSKGTEFDDVYMLVSDKFDFSQDQLRRFYVGITRAKHRLFIHTNAHCFDRLPVDRYKVDQTDYPMPKEIVLQLSHKDVHLGFSRDKLIRQRLFQLRGGDPLEINGVFIDRASDHFPVAKLSLAIQKKLAEWHEKGYDPTTGVVSFIVAWKPHEAPKEELEHPVLLADITLVAHDDGSDSSA